MPFSVATRQGRQILKLEGAVTIRHAQNLVSRLGEGLENGTPLGVVTEGLEDIDTCILQLLCSLRKTVPGLSFDRPSPVLLDAVDRCGLRRELLSADEDL